MNPDRIRSLITHLINSTRSGKFAWQETADEEAFRLVLDAGMIHVGRIRSPNLQGQSNPLVERYELSFFNENNTPVEVWRPEQQDDSRQVREMYEVARDSAINPSEVLQRMEQEVILRSGGPTAPRYSTGVVPRRS